MKRLAVIIPAAGESRRMGLKTPKPFLPLGGVAMVARTIETFQKCRSVGLVQPVLPRAYLPRFRRLMERNSWKSCLPAIAGGRERQDSVRKGLLSLPEDVEIVMIHDGARPLVPSRLITDVLEAADRHGAALAALPLHDTVKKASSGAFVERTVERRGLWLAQTPQAFRIGLILEAHASAVDTGFRGTDDASLVEAIGHPVRIVPGSPLNLKITTPEDLALARGIVSRSGSAGE
jgi:2-C-methyl-D-erythritol 4-phosphate cytidylyltransferase